ncbi:YcxB family protein [Kitasatospora sp. NPDC005856]|uniref:YcxB family protein n=1 Tax=Kitasatospora sp. NPDC005856 TaxID=3154566 RepID=UPI00340A2B85
MTWVEVRYTPTAADFREAFAAWGRRTAAGRRAWRARYMVAAGATVAAGLLAVVGGMALLPAVPLVLFALLTVFVSLRPRVRRVARVAADKGEFRVLLDDYGVVVDTAASVTELGWPEQRYYLETPGLFLLMAGSEDTGVVTMLPKRGVEDVRQLGELIERHAVALVLD